MSHPEGLSEAEVRERRVADRSNTMPSGTGRTYSGIIRTNLFSYFNNILFAVGLVLAVLGRFRDAFIISIVGIVNAVINTFQEIRAKRQLEKIAVLTRPRVTVVRGGKVQEVRDQSKPGANY